MEYLPEFEDFGNFLLSLEAGIEADINDKFSLRVVVKDRYDRTPAPGKEENDFELIAGLKYILWMENPGPWVLPNGCFLLEWNETSAFQAFLRSPFRRLKRE